MGVSDSELFRPASAARRDNKRLAPWHKLSPLLWAPVMYTMRFAARGRVTPDTQHKIFIGMTLLALSHAGYVMSRDSTTAAGS